jgi:hypothetical protein
MGRVGSIGFMSPLVDPAMKVRIVKYDEDKDELVRDANGRCVVSWKNCVVVVRVCASGVILFGKGV